MTVNWSTFLLEILNFGVLVWLLKHFFYRPVLAVIARRREAIEKTLADARSVQSEAQALKSDYESRETQWRAEREAARAKLDEEIAAERDRAMTALRASLAKDREKTQVQEAKRQEEWRRAAEERAIALGAAFAARLLRRVASPTLEAKLVEITLEDLRNFPAEETRAIATNAAGGPLRAKVTSAYPLDEPVRKALGESIASAIGREVEADFAEDRELLAGVRVSFGAWVLHGNLRDELEFFAGAP